MTTKIIPVIHYADDAGALLNARRAFDAGCEGVFLIHMEGRNTLLTSVARMIKYRWPDKLVGINYLGVDPYQAVLANISAGLDMTWTDEQVTHSDDTPWVEAQQVRAAMATAPGHLVFVGVDFKHQRAEPHPAFAARAAHDFGFIPTTSGPATGIAADAYKIADLRAALGEDASLAIASGVTPDNAGQFAPHLSHILVATGVSTNFYEFDPQLLRRLRDVC